MLNELIQLADALEKAGITPLNWHPQLHELPNVSDKNLCYKIAISKECSVANIDTINKDLVKNLRKWEPSNGNSFPGFNIAPLYRITGDEQKKKLKSWREGKETIDTNILREWCSDRTNNWNNKILNKLKKCLNEIPQGLNEIIKSSDKVRTNSIKVLIQRVIKITEPKDFRRSLEEYLWDEITKKTSLKAVLPILIHEGNPKKIKKEDIEKDCGSLSVFLDILDWTEYPVASKDTIEALNLSLLSGKDKDRTSNGSDAFGNTNTGNNEKLPSVKLPIIADVKLRAMNSESVCQYRYGTIDAISFPVGYESRKRTKGALEWLGDESREGETWGRADARELIFAYPSTLPKIPIKLATCLGAQKSDDAGTRFANAARDAIEGLQSISKDLRNLTLSVFSLKKMDKARTKVVFHRNYTAQRLVDAAKEWQIGCLNIPEISIRVWGAEKGKWENFKPIVPYPLQVAQCLNRIWKMDGTTECETPIIPRAKGIELLLEEHTERLVPHLFRVLLQNSKGMILFLGNVINKGEIISLRGLDAHKLLIPSILGLLLYKLGYGKEDYMNDAPFLVGRMLKLADEVHALYCKEVRENNLPPQLIGNTLMTAALDSPVQALAQLALRLKPYYGWAKTFQKGNSAKLAGYFVGQYAETASQLANFELPMRFNDAERAQVLLGYLASNPKKPEK
jgi:hypothetical protein